MEKTHSVPDDPDDLKKTEKTLSQMEERIGKLAVDLENCLTSSSSSDVKDSIKGVNHMIPEVVRLIIAVSAIESNLKAKSFKLLFLRKMSCLGLAAKLRGRLDTMLKASLEWAERIQTIERREKIIKKLKGLSEEVKQKEKEFDIKYHG